MDEGNSTQPPSDQFKERQDSWGIFVLLLCLLLAICVTYVLLRTRFRFLPESIATIVIGFLIGLIVRLAEGSVNPVLTLDPEFFFLFLLPPIMFESGYNIHKGNFFSNFFTVNIFAVVGTIISTVVVGLGIFLFGRIPGIGFDIPVFECLVFGALISAVDPVATLAIFNALEVDPMLHMLVFGESILNDAVAIVLYHTFLQFITQEPTPSLVGRAFLQFFLFFFGSLAIGFAFAVVSALLFKHVDFRRYPTLEIALVFIFAYMPYVFSEAIGLSGIMAILFCGIGMAHYTYYNMTPVTQITTERVFRSLAFLSETVVFAFLGMAVSTFDHKFNFTLVLVTVLMIILGRALNIYPLSFLTNLFRKSKITFTMQSVMFFSGLRGAIAVALILNARDIIPHFHTLLTNTLTIVLFSIVVFGGGTLPLIHLIERCSNHSILKKKVDMVQSREKRKEEDEPDEAEQTWFSKLDNRYLVRWFRKRPNAEAYRSAYSELRQSTGLWPPLRELSHDSRTHSERNSMIDFDSETSLDLHHSPLQSRGRGRGGDEDEEVEIALHSGEEMVELEEEDIGLQNSRVNGRGAGSPTFGG